MVNDCYDETTQTDLDNCREDRRVMALEVGRSDGGTFQEIECKTHLEELTLIIVGCAKNNDVL